MPLQTAALNEAADGVATVAVLMSLHSADPGATGANEVTGGGYARKAVTWSPATGAIASATGTPIVFDGPPSSPATHAALWTSGGVVFLGGEPLVGDSAFNSLGKYNVTQTRIVATPAA